MMIGLVALALQAAAPSGGSIDAAGKWGVDYSPEQCIINRQFGSGPVKSFLAVDANPVTGTGYIVLLIPGVATKGTFGTATMTVAPGGATLRQMWFARGIEGRAGGDRYRDHPGRLGRDCGGRHADDQGAVRVARIRADPRDRQGDRGCQDVRPHAAESWGADPDAMIDTSGPNNSGSWISYSDYPPEALRNGESGTVKILLTIDPKGRPRDCKVVVSSRSPSLDATTCRIMTARAKFEPSSRETRYVFKAHRLEGAMMTAGAPAGAIIALALQAATTGGACRSIGGEMGRRICTEPVHHQPRVRGWAEACDFGDRRRSPIRSWRHRPADAGESVAWHIRHRGSHAGARRDKGSGALGRGATGHDMYAIKLSLADDQWKAVPTAETLVVDAGADHPIAVPIKGIGKAFVAAKTCGRDLLQSWGADPDAMIDLERGSPHGCLRPMIIRWMRCAESARPGQNTGDSRRTRKTHGVPRRGQLQHRLAGRHELSRVDDTEHLPTIG